MRRVRAFLLFSAWLLIAIVPGFVVLSQFDEALPDVETLSDAPPIVAVEPRREAWQVVDDVIVELQVVPGEGVTSGAAEGVVSAVLVEQGETLTYRDPIAIADGQVISYAGGGLPLWRDLAVGAEGDDVEWLRGFIEPRYTAVNQALPEPVARDRFDWTLRSMVRWWSTDVVGLARASDTFSRSWVVWAPERAVRIGDVAVEVGQTISAESELLRRPDRVEFVRLVARDPERPALEWGERTLDVLDQSLGQGDVGLLERTTATKVRDGELTPSDDGAVLIDALLSSDPVDAISVPTSSVIVDQSKTCVLVVDGDGLSPVEVEPLGVAGGQFVLVEPLLAGPAASVVANPIQARLDRTCE